MPALPGKGVRKRVSPAQSDCRGLALGSYLHPLSLLHVCGLQQGRAVGASPGSCSTAPSASLPSSDMPNPLPSPESGAGPSASALLPHLAVGLTPWPPPDLYSNAPFSVRPSQPTRPSPYIAQFFSMALSTTGHTYCLGCRPPSPVNGVFLLVWFTAEPPVCGKQ